MDDDNDDDLNSKRPRPPRKQSSRPVVHHHEIVGITSCGDVWRMIMTMVWWRWFVVVDWYGCYALPYDDDDDCCYCY